MHLEHRKQILLRCVLASLDAPKQTDDIHQEPEEETRRERADRGQKWTGPGVTPNVVRGVNQTWRTPLCQHMKSLSILIEWRVWGSFPSLQRQSADTFVFGVSTNGTTSAKNDKFSLERRMRSLPRTTFAGDYTLKARTFACTNGTCANQCMHVSALIPCSRRCRWLSSPLAPFAGCLNRDKRSLMGSSEIPTLDLSSQKPHGRETRGSRRAWWDTLHNKRPHPWDQYTYGGSTTTWLEFSEYAADRWSSYQPQSREEQGPNLR